MRVTDAVMCCEFTAAGVCGGDLAPTPNLAAAAAPHQPAPAMSAADTFGAIGSALEADPKLGKKVGGVRRLTVSDARGFMVGGGVREGPSRVFGRFCSKLHREPSFEDHVTSRKTL